MKQSATKKTAPQKATESTQPETVSLEQATTEQLKAYAFDLTRKIEVLQNQYRTVLVELQKRADKQY